MGKKIPQQIVDQESKNLRELLGDRNRQEFGASLSPKIARALIHQHEFGIRPISLECAKAYASGLGVTLATISKRWADAIGQGITPNNAAALTDAGHEPPVKLAAVRSLRDATGNVTIPQYAVAGSMGNGLLLPDQPGVIRSWQVSRDWIEKNARAHTGIGNLCIVTGFGPSMQPLFNPGDPLLVDTGVSSVIADGIYFFRVGDEGFIKQLQKIPTKDGVKYIAKSKNADYDPFEITPGMDFQVLGRVIRVWCGTDF